MYIVPTYRISLVKETAKKYPIKSKQISCAGDVALLVNTMHNIEVLDREYVYLLSLNTKNKIIALDTISTGSLDSCMAHAREVFKNSILHNAARIILLHNHPSGDCTPSGEDLSITKQICEAGKILGIPLLDHIIVGDAGKLEYYSIRERHTDLFE